MRVLVTGSTGFVGAHSAAAIAAQGHELRLLVRDRDKAARVGAAVGFAVDDLVVGDVTDRDSVATAIAGCDAVLHAAGVVSLDHRHGAENLRVNRDGARTVLSAAADAGLDAIVHVSSTSALDPSAGRLSIDSPVATGPGYAASKAAAERVARELQAAGAPVRITYPSGVIGPAAGESLGETSSAMARFVAAGVLPTPGASLSLIDVRDLAQVHAGLLEAEAPHRAMCGGTHLTMAELGTQLRAITGRRFPVLPIPARLLRGAGRLADRLASLLPLDLAVDTESMALITTWPGTDDNAPEVLGRAYLPVRDTLADALRAWLDAGLLTSRQAGAIAGASGAAW